MSQSMREHFVSVGVSSSTQGMWHNKGRKCSAPVQLDEIFSVPPLLLPASPALAECLQRVPDESPGASWTEGREGVPWRARSGRHGGREGASNPSTWPFGKHTVNIFIRSWCLTSHDAFLLHVAVRLCDVYLHVHCIMNRGIQVSGVLWVTLGKKAQRYQFHSLYCTLCYMNDLPSQQLQIITKLKPNFMRLLIKMCHPEEFHTNKWLSGLCSGQHCCSATHFFLCTLTVCARSGCRCYGYSVVPQWSGDFMLRAVKGRDILKFTPSSLSF